MNRKEEKNLTILANMRINSQERLQHMKDSFFSFNTISDNWLINIRGEMRKEALAFLRKNLGEKMVEFKLLDDKKGWITNALDMLTQVKYDYILLWNEDHLNIAPQEIYSQLVAEMASEQADYLLYSWWMNGKGVDAFSVLKPKELKHIRIVHLTRERWKKVLKAGYPYYLLSFCGIYRKEFLKKILRKDRRKLPYSFTIAYYRFMTAVEKIIGKKIQQKAFLHHINRMCFHIFRRFPKETPFNIEKPQNRYDILPFVLALPKRELFACIDDDLDMPGYQLIKRGLYPIKKI